ncbi:MAG: hypothetical protein WC673_02335 [Candidatus Paceibacterota bacterium]|jgi:hypothetical protein
MMEQIFYQQLKKRVMARVYAIYVLRQTTSSLCLKTLGLGTGLALGMVWFSWEQIFENMAGSVDGFLPLINYSWSAFLNTELPVQFIVIAGIGMVLWIVWDVFPAGVLTVYKPLRFFRQKVV